MQYPKPDTKLQPIQEIYDVRGYDRHYYCGPTAIAAITNLPIQHVVNTVQRCRGSDAEVVGMTNIQLANVLGVLGFCVESFDCFPNPKRRLTLRRFAYDRGMSPASIVGVTRNRVHHVVALDHAFVVDNHVDGKCEFIDAHPFRLATVRYFIQVYRL